jgi:hypothetical protein
MQCNYFKDNRKKIGANKKGTEDTLLFSCHAGVCEYEPTDEEAKFYCTLDFLHCPRLYTRLKIGQG